MAPTPWTRSAAITLTPPAAGQDELSVSGAGVVATGFVSAPAGVAIPVSLSGGDGTKTFAVTYRDAAENTTTVGGLSVALDATAPAAGPFAIRGALADGSTSTSLTAARTVTLDLSGVSDPASGVAEMLLSESTTFAGASWQPFGAAAPFTLSAGDGTKTVYARFRDAAGNSTTGAVQGQIDLDTTGPASPAVAVVNALGDPIAATSTATVRLRLSAAGSPARALVAENPAFTGAVTVPLGPVGYPYLTGPVLTLSAGDGVKTVYARYVDGAGNLSDPAVATVVLDAAAPGAPGTFAVTGNRAGLPPSTSVTSDPAVTLDLSGVSDAASGVGEMQLSESATFSGAAWVPFSPSPPFVLGAADGSHTVYARFRDWAGNVSARSQGALILDRTAPSAAGFAIRGALADGTASTSFTATASVTLSLAGISDATSGVTEMLVSESAGFAGASWQPFAAAAPFSLSAGDGTKTVYARFRDAAGNASSIAVQGQIALDTTGPTSPTLEIVTAGGAPLADTRSAGVYVRLGIAGGAVQALVADNPVLLGATVVSLVGKGLPYLTPGPVWTLLPPDGAKTLYVRYADDAGNLSPLASATVTYDTTPPLALPPAITPSPWTATGSITLVPPDAGQTTLDVSGPGVVARSGVLAPPGASIPVSLTAGDGAKSFDVTWRDAAGNSTSVPGLSVTLDTTAPVTSAFTVTGTLADGLRSAAITATASVSLDLSGQSDATSGISEMMLSNDAAFAGASWQPFTGGAAVPWVLGGGDGTKSVYARFRDRVGKASSTVQGQIELLETPPSRGAITLAGGARTVSDVRVTAALQASGAEEMRLSVDGDPGRWEPFASSSTVTLAPMPDQGTHTVAVTFRNRARVEGGGASASIFLDQRPPAAPTAVSITGTLADGGTSGSYASTPIVVANVQWPTGDVTVSEMAVFESDDCTLPGAPSWLPLSPATTFVFSGGDGAKRLCVALRDEAGNVGPALPASIVLDTVAPPNPGFDDLATETTHATIVVATVSTLPPDSGRDTALLRVHRRRHLRHRVEALRARRGAEADLPPRPEPGQRPRRPHPRRRSQRERRHRRDGHPGLARAAGPDCPGGAYHPRLPHRQLDVGRRAGHRELPGVLRQLGRGPVRRRRSPGAVARVRGPLQRDELRADRAHRGRPLLRLGRGGGRGGKPERPLRRAARGPERREPAGPRHHRRAARGGRRGRGRLLQGLHLRGRPGGHDRARRHGGRRLGADRLRARRDPRPSSPSPAGRSSRSGARPPAWSASACPSPASRARA